MDFTDHGFMAFTSSCFSGHQQPQLPLNFTEDPSAALAVHSLALTGNFGHVSKTEKAMPVVESMVNLSSLPVSGTGLGGDNKVGVWQSLGGRKRKRNNEKDDEKPREVIHVRAKRGQATDSHSLAERVRREKINERLRCLQDLVPGCYKTMGMAVMLDVIINYVRSLQNQIEFLSMKLSAASMYYDFNSSEMEAMEAMQRTNAYEVQEMERMLREGYGEPAYFNPALPL